MCYFSTYKTKKNPKTKCVNSLPTFRITQFFQSYEGGYFRLLVFVEIRRRPQLGPSAFCLLSFVFHSLQKFSRIHSSRYTKPKNTTNFTELCDSSARSV
jgi:hypothetical protein